jgi:hypothetical protein
MLTADADPDIVRAYREQASLYREAMWMLPRHDAGQAPAFVALQAVRSAASYALAILTGRLADDEDTVAALWHAVPGIRGLAVLPAGANVLALHDDLTLYAYAIDEKEAHVVADAADVFCAWALAVAPEQQSRVYSSI